MSFPTAVAEQCWEEVSGLTTVLQGGHLGHERTKCNQMRGPLWLAQLLRVWKGSGIWRLSDGWAAVGLLDERGSVAARWTWELPPAPAVSRVLALSGPSPVIRPQLIVFRHKCLTKFPSHLVIKNTTFKNIK